jgi:hypothetical protein
MVAKYGQRTILMEKRELPFTLLYHYQKDSKKY